MAKNHKYVNFTDRVACIRIDAIRRTGEKRNAPDVAKAESLLDSSLQRWNELNLASKFTDLSSEISPMVQSLPSVLYNKDRIFTSLENAIENIDIHSAEPIFDLLVNFSRDLGEDFEPFYPRASQVCIVVIRKFQRDDESLEIVELAFNCLAHIFKYLSRLITDNLIPTYDLVRPLFGGEKGFKPRSFVLRFAAESMAFSVRRTSGSNLESIVNHVLASVAADKSNEQIAESTVLLLSTTLKGPGNTSHSKTPVLLSTYFNTCRKYELSDIINRIIVEALHHARSETAQPIISIILEKCYEDHDMFSTQTLATVAGLRKGDRVSNWDAVYDAVIKLAEENSQSSSWSEAAAAILCFADMKSSTTHIASLLRVSADVSSIFRIMEIVSKINTAVLKAFSSFFWTEIYQRDVSKSIASLQLVSLSKLDIPHFNANMKVQESFKFSNVGTLREALKEEDSSLAFFNIWWRSFIGFKVSYSEVQISIESLENLALEDETSLNAFRSNVVAGIIDPDKTSEIHLLKFCDLYLTPNLMNIMAVTIRKGTGTFDLIHIRERLQKKLFTCLSSCDHHIRQSSVELVKVLLEPEDDPNFLIDQCGVINDSPLDLANARNVALRLRSLVSKYKLTGTKSLGSRFVCTSTVHFIFGMLTARLQPVTHTVLECIPMLTDKDPESVSTIALQFIERPEPRLSNDLFASWNMDTEHKERFLQQVSEHLDCHTSRTLQEVYDHVWNDSIDPCAALQSRASNTLSFEHYDDLRLLGIKASCQIPKVAEKHAVTSSIPYLLESKGDDGMDDEDSIETRDFSFSDRTALLELFSKLTKPERLPKFIEIKKQYLYFSRSRHSPLQRLGSKCILSINEKDSIILKKYRENLDALLDDKRFRDAITRFISVGENETEEESLHPDDRVIVLPYVVHLSYGRAQVNGKRNLRHAVLGSLQFLEMKFLDMFVDSANLHSMESHILSAPDVNLLERDSSRKVQGYLTLMNDFVRSLKTKSEQTIPRIVRNGSLPILNKPGVSESKTSKHLLNKSLDGMISSTPKLSVWSPLFPEIMEKLIEPQLENFAVKNLENASAFMKMILSLTKEKQSINLVPENAILSLVETLSYSTVKDTVIELVLQLVLNLATHEPSSTLTQIAISRSVESLPGQMDSESSPESFSSAVEVIIKIFDLDSNTSSLDVVQNLAKTTLKALSKPSKLVPLPVKARVLLALSQIFSSPATSLDLLQEAYFSSAPLFRQFVSRDARTNLSGCYQVFGERIPSYSKVGHLIGELNSFDSERLGEPDFVRRTTAFEEINENYWNSLSSDEWFPLMFNMLFFIRDPDELALRNNGKYSIMRLIESHNATKLVTEYVLPAIKKGLRDTEDKYRRIYIELLSQCAHSDVLRTLNVLLYKGDEEADFFVNINHVQVHRRRRAIQRSGKHAAELDENVIAHYSLSIVEASALHSGSKNPDLNNLADDALHTITELLRHVSPGQFKSVARRWVQELVKEPEPAKLRKNVRVVTAVAQATPAGLDDFVLNVLVAPLHRVLSAQSNEHENLPDRVPIAVAIVYFLKSLREETLEAALPGKLTSSCQMLRSKVPELRDSVRVTLSKIMRILGSKYLKFIISELVGALRRGGMQSHVLGYTVHSILAELNRPHDVCFNTGDTDESAGMIIKVVMDDTFGSIGEEKDSDGYVSAAKEVKQHKSYDTAEISATWTSLSQFGQIVSPLRQFLSANRINTKTEHKIEEVLKRLSAGLHKNEQAATQDAVVMGYEIYISSEKLSNHQKEKAEDIKRSENLSGSRAARIQAARESENFFTVRLSSRDWYENNDFKSKWASQANATKYAATNMHMLQTFALDTLRNVMTSTAGGAVTGSGKGLLTVANAKGSVPIILDGLQSSHDDSNLAALRLATTALRLPVPFAESDDTSNITGECASNFIENSLDTNTLLCQTALKYLTMLIRFKPEFEMKTPAIAYILERIRPDLEEPERQSTAVSFLRVIFARKIMLSQVYDVADTVSRVLVTNQSEHIRVNCRNAYVQFMTTYPLGSTRLNRHLSALAANLRYAAPSGRLSVMETIHLLLQKINTDQLEDSFIQFFSNLVSILVSDSDSDCRKRSSQLIKELIDSDASIEIKEQMVNLCLTWLSSLGKNDTLVRGGSEVSAIFAKEKSGIRSPDSLRLKSIKQTESTASDILKAGQKSSASNLDWQLSYLALDTDVFSMIKDVEGVLLFPHPWVRARAARVFGQYFKSMDKNDLDTGFLIRVGQKSTRQLGAPRLTASDSLQIVKDLVFIIPIWDARNAHIEKEIDKRSEEKRSVLQWLVHKLGSMIRTDISSEEHVGGKTGAIQVLSALPSLISRESLDRYAYDVILSIYIMNDQLSREDAQPDLQMIAQEALSLYDDALGTTEYFKKYSEARQYVDARRRERRAKRSVEAVAEPELAAQKRMKRNSHKHAMRKQKKPRKY